MLCADAAAPRGARSARARETCRGRTEPRRCPAAQRERVAAVTAVSAHFLPFALLPDVAEKAEHQEVTVTGVACSRRTRAPRLLAQHTHGRRATHLRGPARAGRRGSSRSDPPCTERRGASMGASPACVRVGCEGRRCPARELSALACLAGRHAAAWSADGSGLEHRLLWHQATERRQQSPEAADPEGRAAHGWADRDHGEARWRQERRSFRCRRRGEQIRRRHWRGLTCAEATALPPSLHRICARSPRSGTRGG